MNDAPDSTRENVEVVDRFLAAFDRRWPAEDELAELVGPDIRFTERPNLINPGGSERDGEAMRAGLEAGRKLLAWQSYEVRDHVASGDTVVTRMRWSGELAVDAGPWPAGTRMSAWCVAHYRLAAGRIIRIEQHDCYEQPSLPEARRSTSGRGGALSSWRAPSRAGSPWRSPKAVTPNGSCPAERPLTRRRGFGDATSPQHGGQRAR